MTRVLLALMGAAIAGCGGPAKPPQPPPTQAPPPLPPARAIPLVPELQLSEAGVAGVNGDTRATLVELRKKLAPDGYRVRPDNHGTTLVFDVLRGAGKDADQLFYVVPNDDGRLFNVHVTSTKIASALHGWKVGGSLSDLSAMSCECWGEKGDEVATCFHPGEHVAVVYERACADMHFEEARNRKTLEGATVSRLVWQPEPWKVDAPPPAGD